MNKEQIIEKINKERINWMDLSQNDAISMVTYNIVTTCWRTQGVNRDVKIEFDEDTKQPTPEEIIDYILDKQSLFIETLEEKNEYNFDVLNDIYVYILKYLGEEGAEYIKGLEMNQDDEIAKEYLIEADECIQKIMEALQSLTNLRTEALIRLQMLQWFENLLNEKETE